MFVVHMFDEIYLACEDTASLITTVIPSKFFNPEDLSLASGLIVRIKRPSGVKVATRRTANFYGETGATFSISSFLKALAYLFLINFALFQVLIESFSFK